MRYVGETFDSKYRFKFYHQLKNNIYLCGMIDKLFYTIQEVSEELGVPYSTLRYWEKEISRLKPRRTSTGIRRYSKEDVVLLKHIIYLSRDKGYTLDGVKKVLGTQEAKTDEVDMEVISTLKNVKGFLLDLKTRLNRGRSEEE